MTWDSGPKSTFSVLLKGTQFPCRRKWQPTPVLLPGKSHGQRSLVDYSPWDRKESDMTERLHFHRTQAGSCYRTGNWCIKNCRGHFSKQFWSSRSTAFKSQRFCELPGQPLMLNDCSASRRQAREQWRTTGRRFEWCLCLVNNERFRKVNPLQQKLFNS